jgi:hypothetical protein
MAVQKIKSGRVLNVASTTYLGERGTIFYDEAVGDLRLSDGLTLGGKLILTGNTGTLTVLNTATSTQLGGIKVGTGLTISSDGILSTTGIGSLDGGSPASIYGGVEPFDAGGII